MLIEKHTSSPSLKTSPYQSKVTKFLSMFHCSWFPNTSGGVHGYGQAPSSRNNGGGGGGGGGGAGGWRAFGGAGNRLGN